MSARTKRPSGPLDFLWRALNSLPVAIYVMLALTLLSGLGTLIPQSHLNPQPPGLSFPEFMTERYGASKAELLDKLGFDHIYFTWYFNALLTWLAVSAVICNVVRWRTTVRLWKTPQVKRGARFFAADRRSWQFEGRALDTVTPLKVSAAIAEDLQLLGYRIRTESDGDTQLLYADRGFWKKWALVLLHVAILVLLAGGFYGAATGVKGDIRLANGETETLTIDIAAGKYNWVQPWLKLLPKPQYELQQHKFRIDWSRKLVLEEQLKESIPPDLQDYFWYFVHDYVSELEVEHKGKTVRREVKVNHPLVIEKLHLYQSGYDQRGYVNVSRADTPVGQNAGADKSVGPTELRLPDPVFGTDTWYALADTGKLELVVQNRNGEWVVPIEQGDDYALRPVPSGAVSGRSFQVNKNVISGDVYRHGERTGSVGPLAIFALRDNRSGTEMGNLLLTDVEGFDTAVGAETYTIRLSPRTEDYSVFAYKRDPGSPVLLLGWLLLVAGIAATMFVPFTQLWVRAEPGKLSVLALGPMRSRLKRRLDVMLGIDS